ncbi:MAG: L,D-transpeptidase, partial [Clostridium sp.]
VKDGRLGMRISDGCVRLAKENAKWIYDNVPERSSIHIE